MASAPAFQFYANDFTTGTQDWSVEEVGIYIRLLCYQWDKGYLPNDQNRLSRIAGCDLETLKKAWVFVGLKFLIIDDVLLKNSRLEKTRAEQVSFREKQRLNGCKGGRPRKEETQTKPKQNPTTNPKHNPNKTSSSSSSNRYINISFDLFWNEYDKKVGKVDCEKKWLKLSDEQRSKIMEYLPAYIDSKPDKKFRKDPETFINNKTWEDEIIVGDLFSTQPSKFKILQATGEGLPD